VGNFSESTLPSRGSESSGGCSPGVRPPLGPLREEKTLRVRRHRRALLSAGDDLAASVA